MSEDDRSLGEPRTDGFADQAKGASPGFVREFWGLLRDNKKWWLTPIIIAMVLISALVVLSSTAVAPFIYTLF